MQYALSYLIWRKKSFQNAIGLAGTIMAAAGENVYLHGPVLGLGMQGYVRFFEQRCSGITAGRKLMRSDENAAES